MNNRFTNIVLFILIVSIASCLPKTAAVKKTSSEEKANFIKATIINYKLDGCGWMLQLEDERKLQPVNLKDEFKKEDLKVWIQYQTVKQGSSICMAGEMITIIAIEIRK